ncbi:hypothetical protein PVK06_043250 [Gossypium arboreum]|uniref:Uncharacterized protein n=1 Tax=Gossypium arboreum TaxID=29729 RepID=A0ABR0MMY9_GOSAR|nr:hypothetical protein PVK06_043250 [Gossypium arboreum]
MLLLHSIIKGRRVNVRRIIFQEVHQCAEKNAGSFNFPSLITTLCRTARVPFNAEEDITHNKGRLTRTIFAKIQGNETTRATHHSYATTSSAMHTPTTTPPVSRSFIEQQIAHSLKY